jgi:hypothetical protein
MESAGTHPWCGGLREPGEVSADSGWSRIRTNQNPATRSDVAGVGFMAELWIRSITLGIMT